MPYADLGQPQSLNLYSYVLNNPTTSTDPDGHWCFLGIGNSCPPAKVENCGNPCNVTASAPLLSPCFGGDAVCNASGQVVREVGLSEDVGVEFAAVGAARGLVSALASALLPVLGSSAGAEAGELTLDTSFNSGDGILHGETTGFTDHGLSRAIERGVTKNEIEDALSQASKQDAAHPASFSFNGRVAKVVASRITGKIVTVIARHAPGSPIIP